MISLAEITTQMNVCRTLALALPVFYKKTGISVSFNCKYNPEDNGLEVSLGFLPKEPSDEEYNVLFEEIIDAEKLLINEYIITSSSDFENLKQMVFKHKESTKQIVDKHKKMN